MSSQGSASSAAARPVGLEHRPGLDGIRACAVVAIIAYHTLTSGVPGGFLSVDVFFTLSGYLITALLVAEWRGSGTISLRRFWTWRARRLLPALFLMLIGVGVGAAIWPQLLSGPSLRGDSLATVFYFANWHLITQHSNYFMVSSHVPLQHTWSLAIEEQFYLVWPVVVLGALTIRIPLHARRGRDVSPEASEGRRRRRLALLLWLSVGGAIASAVWMAVITPAGPDTARSYYGSDTRAQSLLVGSALAFGVALWGPALGRRASRLLSWVGVSGALGVAALWAFLPDTSYLAFHGGFLLTALGTAGVIACITMKPRSAVGSILGVRPLRFVGRISYGMYLWYWPTLLVLTASNLHMHGVQLLAVRLVVITAIAAASAHFVEMPIRRGRLKAWPTAIVMPAAASLAVLTIFVATVDVVGASASQQLAASVAPNSRRVAPATAPGSSLFAATAGQPVKVLIVGDSVAGTLGVGLGRVSARYGVVAVNEGIPGCSVSMDRLVQVFFFVDPPTPPCRPGDPASLFSQWKAWVDQWNPDVVLYIARGDVLNQEIGSNWEHIGEPAFDSYLAGRLHEAVSVLGSRGAHVVVLTTPYYDTGALPNGSAFPEDDPSRVATDNRLIGELATGQRTGHMTSPPLGTSSSGGPGASDPVAGGVGGVVEQVGGIAGGIAGGAGSSVGGGDSGGLGGGVGASAGPAGGASAVTVIDLGGWISPGGRYSTIVDGVQMRCGDGVHFTVAGGEWVAQRLLPEVAVLGRAHQAASPDGSWSGNIAQVAPSWYPKLPC